MLFTASQVITKVLCFSNEVTFKPYTGICKKMKRFLYGVAECSSTMQSSIQMVENSLVVVKWSGIQMFLAFKSQNRKKYSPVISVLSVVEYSQHLKKGRAKTRKICVRISSQDLKSRKYVGVLNGLLV
jgi:hypothetical protein